MLRELLKLFPSERFVYYADTAHCPYGDKDAGYIIDRARTISTLLMAKGCTLIVVACNTATAAAISALRSEFRDFPFVGMEPAVKPAALSSRTNVIGVLATAGTLKGSNYLDLRNRYCDSVKVVEHVGRGFVELVENGILDGPIAESTVKASLQPLLDEDADTIVLGCTHYPFLEKVIARIAGNQVRIINPAPAVAAQARRIYTPGIEPSQKVPSIEFLSSADIDIRSKALSLLGEGIPSESVQ